MVIRVLSALALTMVLHENLKIYSYKYIITSVLKIFFKSRVFYKKEKMHSTFYHIEQNIESIG
jgi:hypothetical protein